MSARNKNEVHRAEPDPGPHDIDQVRESISRLLLEAATFVAPSRVDETARGLLPRTALDAEFSDREVLAVADAIGMAMDLSLFTPSASGQTAFDRLAKQRRGLSAADVAALDVLRWSAFRLLRIEAGSDGAAPASLRDLVSGEMLQVIDDDVGADLAGVTLVARVGLFGDGRHMIVSGVTPLDEAGLAVALGFVRPGERAKLLPRCAEAVYRHVLRHGTIEIPGLNRPPEGDEPDEISELDQIAQRWAEPGAARDPADIQLVRTQSDLGAVLDVVASAAGARAHGRPALCASYMEILGVQLEAVHRRQFAGSGSMTLDAVAAAVEAEIASGALPPNARDILAEARRRLGAAVSDSGGRDAELDRLIGRIQALRAKTVDQGCTEAEALAAAEKVAELLDRYGLSLSELDLQRQTCEGAAVETSRKRAGPVDDCVPAIAAFFDCRAWSEKGRGGTLRYVFFGLPADVAAARYLYGLVELAFDTETAAFRAGPTYAAMPSGLRRTATNSFGIGFARGIVAKLHTVRTAREAALRGATGRDLVVAKADVVDTEVKRLGLRFRARKGPANRRVLNAAYAEGHEAGLGFEYVPGISDGN